MTGDESESSSTTPTFSEGDRVEYAEEKTGVVIGLVPAPPETDDPYTEDLWKELINRAAMMSTRESRLLERSLTRNTSFAARPA